ncbi:heavy metal-associated isoprenylated plant protein 3-like isoform X2 [Diospyros lotus]|uniref:heavy metal-associated isoprenylated plant protein 3-like isoform X2 n=1 Tax=Diospyros lotus TaxID=55363 RepID=UPI002257D0AA|nr:heavy metal-associated isoprenylated plant protein 3-like isoform X2 [Diospyros lotus]
MLLILRSGFKALEYNVLFDFETVVDCEGIESVDGDSNELTVTGEVDEETLRELVGQMVSKKAQSNTPPPSKIRNNSYVEGVRNAEKATVEKLPKNPNQTNLNESPVRTAVMMVDLHCQGCIDKICKVIKKTRGYHGMSIDRQKNAVTVKGTMDMTALAKRLSKKLNKRPVSIAPPDDHGGLQADADSPSPAKDMIGAASKPGKGVEPQKDLDGNKSNKPPVTTTVLKVDVPCYCDGHSDGIRGVVANTKGFHSCEVSIDDMGKIVVRVTGSVDVNDLKEKLEKKLKKPVEITQPPPIFNDIDDGGDMGKSVGDGGETYTQDAPTWHLDPHMYGYYRAYHFP